MDKRDEVTGDDAAKGALGFVLLLAMPFIALWNGFILASLWAWFVI